LRIVFQKDELFISPCADVGGQGAIIGSEIRVRRWIITRAGLEG
jgi:hypothetical protein